MSKIPGQLHDGERIAARVEAHLGELSDSLAKAVRARVMDDLSYDEVAALLGCTVNAARVRVSRALAQLLDRFGDIDPYEVIR